MSLQGAKAVHIEEDSTGVFHLYILPLKHAAETTINASTGNITRISFSVFPSISQYTYDSFVTIAKTPQRVLDNKHSVEHVEKNWWKYHQQLHIFFLLLIVFLEQLRLPGKSSNFMLLFGNNSMALRSGRSDIFCCIQATKNYRIKKCSRMIKSRHGDPFLLIF